MAVRNVGPAVRDVGLAIRDVGPAVRDVGLTVRYVGPAAALCPPAPGPVSCAACALLPLFINDRLLSLFAQVCASFRRKISKAHCRTSV